MPRFTRMLADGMTERGHQVSVWSPQPQYFKSAPAPLKKWFGYIDQYIKFPREVSRKIKTAPADTLFILTDHALGPWLPLIANRPNVVHCHDFLAQQSALDLIPQNPTSFTGKIYQDYIRKGYSKAKNFISVSKKTELDLFQFIDRNTINSFVVYNGLNQSFQPNNIIEARVAFSKETNLDLSKGYILHVGGNQWYKNRAGIVAVYNAWRNQFKKSLPLILVGDLPDAVLQTSISESAFKSSIYSFHKISDELISDVYSGSSVFLFPSLAEGFGWPIAEAMACGCPVITTDEAPMTEVAGDAGILIPVMPGDEKTKKTWADNVAQVVEKVVSQSAAEREEMAKEGIINAARFNSEHALDKIESIYQKILLDFKSY